MAALKYSLSSRARDVRERDRLSFQGEDGRDRELNNRLQKRGLNLPRKMITEKSSTTDDEGPRSADSSFKSIRSPL